jgi:hypothetical protein
MTLDVDAMQRELDALWDTDSEQFIVIQRLVSLGYEACKEVDRLRQLLAEATATLEGLAQEAEEEVRPWVDGSIAANTLARLREESR